MVSVVGRCCNLVNTQVPGAPVLRRTGASVHSTLTRPARSEVSLVLTTPGVTPDSAGDRSRAAPGPHIISCDRAPGVTAPVVVTRPPPGSPQVSFRVRCHLVLCSQGSSLRPRHPQTLTLASQQLIKPQFTINHKKLCTWYSQII